MKKNVKNYPAQMPTRKAKRAAAKYALNEIPHLFKKIQEKDGKRASYFAIYWKEFV